MKTNATQITFKAGMVVLCLTSIVYTPSRVSSERVTRKVVFERSI